MAITDDIYDNVSFGYEIYIASVISMVIISFVIYTYVKVESFRKSPGGLFIWMAIYDLIFTLSILTFDFIYFYIFKGVYICYIMHFIINFAFLIR